VCRLRLLTQEDYLVVVVVDIIWTVCVLQIVGPDMQAQISVLVLVVDVLALVVVNII